MSPGTFGGTDMTDEPTLPANLTAAIGKMNKWVDRQQASDDISKKLTHPLYHYTSATSLLNIVKNQSLWFTSIFHLNDPGELAYGIEVAVDVVDRVGRDHAKRGEKAPAYFCLGLRDALTRHLGAAMSFYVSSFSRAPNDLGQWRAYGDDGRGYALGLSHTLFKPDGPLSIDNKPDFFVAQVQYGKHALKRKQERAVKFAVKIAAEECAKGVSDVDGRHFFERLASAVAGRLLWNSLVTKHEAYASEQEVRLFMVGSKADFVGHVETRARGSQIVPYISCPLPLKKRGVIVQVGIGPAAPEDAEDGVSSFLASHGLGRVPHPRSDIPYRSAHDLY